MLEIIHSNTQHLLGFKVLSHIMKLKQIKNIQNTGEKTSQFRGFFVHKVSTHKSHIMVPSCKVFMICV